MYTHIYIFKLRENHIICKPPLNLRAIENQDKRGNDARNSMKCDASHCSDLNASNNYTHTHGLNTFLSTYVYVYLYLYDTCTIIHISIQLNTST